MNPLIVNMIIFLLFSVIFFHCFFSASLMRIKILYLIAYFYITNKQNGSIYYARLQSKCYIYIRLRLFWYHHFVGFYIFFSICFDRENVNAFLIFPFIFPTEFHSTRFFIPFKESIARHVLKNKETEKKLFVFHFFFSYLQNDQSHLILSRLSIFSI